ncbi:MAG: nitrogen fixation protein FixP [Halobacteriovoraceae bacterium]|nr:nitrogen fixation protein FixP [Halobacteriovoraceae bacterium]|tara:strand:- start:12120 stop:12719 length:600 start_codon:yes stop_codon:yes gene_type:complete
MSDHRKDDEMKVFEDEKKILMDHEYDGIKELNHPLPKWWLITFYLTIAYAVPYYLAHTFFGAKTIQEEFKEDMNEVSELQADYLKRKGGFILAEYEKVKSDPGTAKLAKKTFKRKCKACHLADGGGSIGPNLTDEYWIHGDGSVASNYEVLYHGVVDKGMPEWGTSLGKERIYAVLTVLEEMKNTHVEGGKEPQGKKVE